MPKVDKNEVREERIRMEIVVDAYDRHERAIGWYIYPEETIRFPFEARCLAEREVSPLEEGETAQVVGMSSAEASESEMVVTIEWMDRELGVPLAQLEPIDVDPDTEQAVADWHYWDGPQFTALFGVGTDRVRDQPCCGGEGRQCPVRAGTHRVR